jgi:hypothetical protein
MAAISTNELVPAPEASLRLGISREQLIRRIQRGDIPGVLRGGRWLASLADVERLEKIQANLPMPRNSELVSS